MSACRIGESLLIAAAAWLGVQSARVRSSLPVWVAFLLLVLQPSIPLSWGQTCCGSVCGDCCSLALGPGCNDSYCCEAVCQVIPSCCTTWTVFCRDLAKDICPVCGGGPACGNPDMGDCCSAHSNPYCNKKSCCEAVCEIDPSCCEVEWTQCCADLAYSLDDACPKCTDSCEGFCGGWNGNSCMCDSRCHVFGDCCFDVCCECDFGCPCELGTCAGNCGGQSSTGCFCDEACFFFSDCCNDVCDACPGIQYCTPPCPGAIVSATPPTGTIDARQPYDPPGSPLLGIGHADEPILVSLPEEVVISQCLSICQSSDAGYCGVDIAVFSGQGNAKYLITLSHPIVPGAVTRIYYGPPESGDYVEYISHPGNVNGDAVAGPGDVLFLVDILNGVKTAPFGLYSSDIDRSGVVGPPDVLRLIDLLNGAQAYQTWNLTPLPTNEGVCP